MNFSPETQILILNGTILAVAYLGIFPSLAEKTLDKMMTIDVVLSVIALGVAAALFWGSGTPFTLVLIDVNWAVFTVVTLMVMETPLFLRFARRHGITLWDKSDD